MRLLPAVVCLVSVDVCVNISEFFHSHFTLAYVTQARRKYVAVLSLIKVQPLKWVVAPLPGSTDGAHCGANSSGISPAKNRKT